MEKVNATYFASMTKRANGKIPLGKMFVYNAEIWPIFQSQFGVGASGGTDYTAYFNVNYESGVWWQTTPSILLKSIYPLVLTRLLYLIRPLSIISMTSGVTDSNADGYESKLRNWHQEERYGQEGCETISTNAISSSPGGYPDTLGISTTSVGYGMGTIQFQCWGSPIMSITMTVNGGTQHNIGGLNLPAIFMEGVFSNILTSIL